MGQSTDALGMVSNAIASVVAYKCLFNVMYLGKDHTEPRSQTIMHATKSGTGIP